MKFSSRTRRRAPRSSRTCRPIIRSNRAHGRPAARLAVGTHRGFGKRHQRDSRGGREKTSEKVSTSSFIAAARRAAQAAAAAQPVDGKGPRGSVKKPAGDKAKEGSTITSKIRSLLVGASVVVIVLGTFKMAMSLLDGGSAAAGTRDREFERAAGRGAAARAGQRQAGDAGSGGALDDVADPDRPAIAQ